eukprot:Skav216855  [mRNA]  locus=scaffold1042:76020:77971:+ [translate_table: standard]
MHTFWSGIARNSLSVSSVQLQRSTTSTSLVLLHHQGTLLLGLLHLCLFIAIWLPQATMKHLRCCVMHLLPAMEAATLAQRAHSVGEGVVDVVEQHLVPPVLATQYQGHDVVQHRPSSCAKNSFQGRE